MKNSKQTVISSTVTIIKSGDMRNSRRKTASTQRHETTIKVRRWAV